MYENDGVQIFQAIDPKSPGVHSAHPVTYHHPNLIDFYNINVILWVSDDAGPVSNTSFVFKALNLYLGS